MNVLTEMSDEEFVPFLHELGVDTYKKSFEWMLSDREFAGVMRWLHDNLDHNNALTAREECRYTELEKKGLLHSQEDLESSIATIQEQYEGISLPGDKEAKEDIKLEIKMLKEQLHLLERQESVVNDLKKRNELTKEELATELTKLNAALLQSKEDESSAGEDCVTLAQEVENITDGVIDVIAGTLDMYNSCHCDKENAKKFFTFGPFDTYRQSQVLFRSHFDLFTSKKLAKRINETSSDEELRTALLEARSMEERLSDALCSYIESTAELCGTQAEVTLVSNCKDVHPSQITTHLMEAQSAVELLQQEETILYQQLHAAVKQLVEERTSLAVETTAACALAVRQQIHSDLSHLLDSTQRALGVDRVVYTALRHELRTVVEVLQLAAQLRQYVVADSQAVISRIDSMNQITEEQASCEVRLQSSDVLVQSLLQLLGGSGSDSNILLNMYLELESTEKELKENVAEGYKRREEMLSDFKTSTLPLRAYIWSGCTRQPISWDSTVSSLIHTLKQQLDTVDKRVLDASNLYASVKNGDKQCLRKLWQWFLTDPARLMTALKNGNSKV